MDVITFAPWQVNYLPFCVSLFALVISWCDLAGGDGLWLSSSLSPWLVGSSGGFFFLTSSCHLFVSFAAFSKSSEILIVNLRPEWQEEWQRTQRPSSHKSGFSGRVALPTAPKMSYLPLLSSSSWPILCRNADKRPCFLGWKEGGKILFYWTLRFEFLIVVCPLLNSPNLDSSAQGIFHWKLCINCRWDIVCIVSSVKVLLVLGPTSKKRSYLRTVKLMKG